ncbi:hypothetical protein VZG28_04935 [Synechococcus elongatus IITB4]|uniref:hypothetical protein n=1 Tax=Synechococcus elongatus TaxID=32046 RepID=UPI0030CC7514
MTKSLYLGYLAFIVAATTALLPEALQAIVTAENRVNCAILAYDAHGHGFDYSTEFRNCME